MRQLPRDQDLGTEASEEGESAMIRELVLKKVKAVMASRPPDFEIGPPDDRYLQRWIVFPWGKYERGSKPKNRVYGWARRLPNIYLHKFRHDDEDRALHDHPFPSCSWLIENAYWEVMFYPMSVERIAELMARGKPRPTVKVFRREGSVHFRAATAAHRVVLERAAGIPSRSIPVISIFFVGPVVRHWGFHCKTKWVPWQEFVGARDKGSVGRGCGED
jgi:hypothetical protein